MKKRPSLLLVAGLVLIAAGGVVGGHAVWTATVGDTVAREEQQDAGRELSESFTAQQPELPPPGEVVPVYEPAPAMTPAAPGAAFAVLFVPRFGTDYHRVIAEGVDQESVLDSGRLGIGRYSSTQMPGEYGQFAVVGHRSAYGGAMHDLDKLQLNDAMYVQTAEGWFTYRFRTLEYITPTQGEALLPVPHQPDLAPGDKLISLMSCNPLWSTAERMLAYGVFEGFSTQTPAELAN